MSTTSNESIRVLIVDDHAVVRIGLKTLLANAAGFRVVGEAGTVAEAINLAVQARPDVVLMDVRLPDGSGVEACRRIKADNPEVRVVMLTSYQDEEAIVGAQLVLSSAQYAPDTPSAATGENADALPALIDLIRWYNTGELCL